MIKMSEYLTVGEAASYLGVSKDSLRRWDRAGKLKARRHPVSRYRLYLKYDLESFLSSVSDSSAGGRPRRGKRARSA